jgi:hypothetical protein
MPLSTDLTDALIALIPEDGSRISNAEIKAALEQGVGEPLSDALVEEAKNLVVAMGAAEKARGPGGGLKAAGIQLPPRAANPGRSRRNGNGTSAQGRKASDASPPASPPPDPGDPSRGFSGWVAPPERDLSKAAMEKSLWEAADQFRANSGLKAQEYSGPILGLIFLRFADVRFMPQWQALKAAGGSERRGSREEDANAYQSEGLLYLPTGARFQELLQLPEAEGHHTLAGFLLERFQHIPTPGETLRWKGSRYTVLSMDGPRIERVKILTANGEGADHR